MDPDSSPPSPRGLLGRSLRALGKLALGLLLALVLAELGLRSLAPQGLVTEQFRYEALPGGDQSGPGYRLQPLLFLPGPVGGRVNSLGLRGEELGSKGAGERWALVGDSFVYGAGVATDEALPAALGAELAVQGRELQVVNAGTPGYGTVRQLAWLETFGDELEADRVVLCLFVGNDLTDNLTVAAPRIVDGRLFFDEGSPGGVAADRARIWRNELHLWRLLQRRSLPRSAPTSPTSPGEVAPAGDQQRAASLARLQGGFARQQAERLGIYLPGEAPPSPELTRIQTAYEVTGLALEGVASWCAERGLALALVLIPDVLQVDAELRASVLAAAGLEPGDLDLERPQRELAAAAAGLELPCLDLLGPMRVRQAELRGSGGPTDMGLYLFGDSHWSAAGHALAAELLAEALAGWPGWSPGS